MITPVRLLVGLLNWTKFEFYIYFLSLKEMFLSNKKVWRAFPGLAIKEKLKFHLITVSANVMSRNNFKGKTLTWAATHPKSLDFNKKWNTLCAYTIFWFYKVSFSKCLENNFFLVFDLCSNLIITKVVSQKMEWKFKMKKDILPSSAPAQTPALVGGWGGYILN